MGENRTRVLAIILAAGESKRMGRNKLLLPWGHTSVLQQTIMNVKASNVDDVVLVTGHDDKSIMTIALATGMKTIHNKDYAKGFLASVQTAVRRVPNDVAAVLIMLGDQPMVGPDVINALLSAYQGGQKGLVAPAFQGQRGNPVIIDRRYLDELLSLPVDSAPRALLQRHPDDIVLVDIESDAVLHDLDLPEDYARWKP